MAEERIVIRVSGKGTRTVSRDLKGIGTSAEKSSGGVNVLKRALAGVGGALAVRELTKTLAEFSQSMSTVKAITQATGGEFDELRDKAKDLGSTTRFAASEAADGMVFLARAGFEANEVLATITGTLQLAQAGGLELASAADIASNVLQGFRLEVAETARVVDVLALAANSSNTDVFQLGDALKFVAPIAAGVGVTIEETTAAIGALSNAGLQASSAGTGLRRVLSELESPSSKTIKLLRIMKVDTDEVKISQVGLTAALDRLREAGIDTGQALELFGDRGGPAFEVLSSSIADVKRMTQELKNAEGTAKRIAETMDENLNGALFAVKSAFEAVIIAAGDFGAESLLTGSMRALAGALRALATNIDDVITVLGLLATAFIALKLPAITAGVIGLGVAVQQLGFTLLFLAANPVILVGAAIAAVVTTLFLLRDSIKVSSDGLVTLGDVGASVFDALKAVIGGVGDLFSMTFGVLKEGIKTVGDIFDDVFFAIEKITGFTLGGIVTKMEAVKELGSDILDLLQKIPGIGAVVEIGRLIAEGARVRGELRATEELIARLEKDALAAAPPAVPGAAPPPPAAPAGMGLANVFEDLQQQARLLKLVNSEREIQNNFLQIQSKLSDELSPKDAERLINQLRELQALQDRANLLDEIKAPQEDFNRGQAALNALLADGAITADEFNKKMRELRQDALADATDLASGVERGMMRVRERVTDLAAGAENAFVNAFKGMEDALVKFITTGKLEFSSLARSIIADITRIAIQKSIIGPLTAPGGLLRFADGGSFTVGGTGGTDSQTVAFRATPGEQVTINRPGQSGGGGSGGGVNVKMTVIAQDADSFRRSEGQIGARLAASISRAQRRNG